ncbi:nucleotidyltransferase domain-containing protein [Marinicrinis sediminis]|uniref:Nucleotidyltransferase domain-containing protein n=1 Tax=Marinicrinis sediminis TaxID=1652465 RepID=A0ABW5R9L8_9BACL
MKHKHSQTNEEAAVVSSSIRAEINQQLRQIEQEEQIRILYACESGSRAWGFPSQDSDYDVRFLYIRPEDWYLSIFEKRDVIERPISSQLDISGWDLKKALYLFHKSNPPLMEWLMSPICYIETTSAAERIRELSPFTFSPKACLYHYLNMAKGNFRTYLQGEQVKIKKYFYVLRPMLACAWIQRYDTMPPMAFRTLVDTLVPADSALYEAIQALLGRKMAGEELDLEPRIEPIHQYLTQAFETIQQEAANIRTSEGASREELDDLFRAMVSEGWSTG